MPVTMTCKQCGTANRLGSIFCKQCGAKLDMEEAHRDLQERRENFNFDDFKHYFGIVRRLLAWALLVVVVVILVGLFLPAPMPSPSSFDAQESKQLTERYNQLLQECLGSARTHKKEHEFSAREASFLANWLMGLDGQMAADIGYALAPQEISVSLLSSQYIRLTLRSKAFKKVNVYSTLTGRLVERDGALTFVPASGRIGKIGLPGPARGIVVERFKPLFAGIGQLEMLARSLDSAEVFEGQLVLRARRKK